MHIPISLREELLRVYTTEYRQNADLFYSDIRAVLEQSVSAQSTRARREDLGQVVVEAKHLSKEYRLTKHGEPIHALRDASLRVYEKEIVALMGASGSGKSTMMHMIGGLDTPTSGEIEVFGKNVHTLSEYELSAYRNATIGFIFQFFYLQPYLSVIENIEVPLMFRPEISRTERRVMAMDAVRAVGLEERSNHLPNQLSGGQMQRVAIARALIGKPKLILADEPTGNLDQSNGKDILELLQKINVEYNTTIVIVTHDPLIARCADRIITLSDGKTL